MEVHQVEAVIRSIYGLPDAMLQRLHKGKLADPVQKLFVDIVFFIKSGDYGRAHKLLVSAGVREQTKKAIQRTTNDCHLLQRSVEWVKPGVIKTFRFWSEAEKQSYLQLCTEACEAMRASGLDACLGFGSVLSFVRDRDFIPHDDDLDIIVAMPPEIRDFTSALADVKARLKNAGYEASGKFYSHFHVRKTGQPGKVIDIFVGIREGETVTWFPGPRSSLLYSEIFPPMASDFLGLPVHIPANPFNYLAKIYGPDWHKPQPLWNHAWDLELVRDLLGDRN